MNRKALFSLSISLILLPIGALALPPADFTYFPDLPRPGQIVVFEATYDPDVAYRSWNYGDGTPPRENIRIDHHTFAQAGKYTVILTVKDAKGLPNQTSRLVTVSEPGPPTADFTVTAQSGVFVSFQDLSTDPDDNIVTWIWDFGDGVRHSESSLLGQTITRSAQHTYGAPGSYTVMLTVEDAEGNRNQKSRPVTVTESAGAPTSYGSIPSAPGYVPAGASASPLPQTTPTSPIGGFGISTTDITPKVLEWVFKFAISIFVIIVIVALFMRYRG